jgi:hypothetical protein
MPLQINKPHTWLKFDSTTGIYKIGFAVELNTNKTLGAAVPSDNFSTRTRTISYIIQSGGAGGLQDFSYDNNPADTTNPFDPTRIDYIVIEVKDAAGNKKGKSTTCTNEADASGGGEDLSDRYARLRRP